jgi:hypothetical protein
LICLTVTWLITIFSPATCTGLGDGRRLALHCNSMKPDGHALSMLATGLRHKSTIPNRVATQKKPAIGRIFSIHLAKKGRRRNMPTNLSLSKYFSFISTCPTKAPRPNKSRLYIYYRQSAPDSLFHCFPSPNNLKQ